MHSEYNNFLVHHIRECLDNQISCVFASQFFDSLFPLRRLFLVFEVLLADEAKTVVPCTLLNILHFKWFLAIANFFSSSVTLAVEREAGMELPTVWHIMSK